MTRTLDEILRDSASRHRRLCPRQVLGARMGLCAAEILGLELPRADQRLLVIAETDGCTVDGLSAATGCRVGNRTLRILDFGKVAATFTDTSTESSIRIVPASQARKAAAHYAPGAQHKWGAMLSGYQIMPASELFVVQQVQLNTPVAEMLSRPGRKAICDGCGEEVMNGREVLKDDLCLCRACSGEGYYRLSVPVQLPREAITLTKLRV